MNLREIWPHEEHNFTPWLAENLNELGEELGLTLESPRTEVEVGQYRLDIQSEEAEGGTVVIENQLGWTDHDHLGKLLTYAAGGEADYVVWVAAYFTAEHRAAIDWLNRLDPEKVWFFGSKSELSESAIRTRRQISGWWRLPTKNGAVEVGNLYR